ncbi:unnamed protein product [Vitrella brassicaformis CCMP3155]|uniref:Uncharacterized protein n=1 Tax=Vitrella brassicaformis (strain CCMP3155) TaxID=1169540 RepID=A0A0G4EWB7_VITBC|nr:unnamed protein product [Vitrella brassicaformis CCMP3155]|eukprot:CEM02333.1 unnamed protein product [Vitrella brassicaformis CCMP3155]
MLLGEESVHWSVHPTTPARAATCELLEGLHQGRLKLRRAIRLLDKGVDARHLVKYDERYYNLIQLAIRHHLRPDTVRIVRLLIQRGYK